MPHSSGPWRAVTDGLWAGKVYGGADEAHVVGHFYAMADAALIAAAPELAVALRKVTARLRAAYDNAPAECVLEAEALLKRINEGGG